MISKMGSNSTSAGSSSAAATREGLTTSACPLVIHITKHLLAHISPCSVDDPYALRPSGSDGSLGVPTTVCPVMSGHARDFLVFVQSVCLTIFA